MTDNIEGGEVMDLIEPEPLFSCSDENCRIECSWPAGDLRQCPEGPICENCYDENARSDEPRYETLPPFVPTFQAELTQARADIARLREELSLWRMLVKEGGVPRYTVTPGAALNTVVTSTDALLRQAALKDTQ